MSEYKKTALVLGAVVSLEVIWSNAYAPRDTGCVVWTLSILSMVTQKQMSLSKETCVM